VISSVARNVSYSPDNGPGFAVPMTDDEEDGGLFEPDMYWGSDVRTLPNGTWMLGYIYP